MTYLKINDTKYPATFRGYVADPNWDGRSSTAITVEMDYNTAATLFVDDAVWSVIEVRAVPTANTLEDGSVVYENVETEFEYPKTDYVVAGDITDHRNGTITVKMGKPTDLEKAYELLYGGI